MKDYIDDAFYAAYNEAISEGKTEEEAVTKGQDAAASAIIDQILEEERNNKKRT
jgi:predicted RNase H-like HicB family nuclease